MVMDKKSKSVPISYVRGLLVAQEGKCALSGKQLTPDDTTVDHIVALSRTELSPSFDMENIWLAHKRFNAMKGTMTYDELIEACRMILANREASQKLLAKIRRHRIRLMSKKAFEEWEESLRTRI